MLSIDVKFLRARYFLNFFLLGVRYEKLCHFSRHSLMEAPGKLGFHSLIFLATILLPVQRWSTRR